MDIRRLAATCRSFDTCQFTVIQPDVFALRAGIDHDIAWAKIWVDFHVFLARRASKAAGVCGRVDWADWLLFETNTFRAALIDDRPKMITPNENSETFLAVKHRSTVKLSCLQRTGAGRTGRIDGVIDRLDAIDQQRHF